MSASFLLANSQQGAAEPGPANSVCAGKGWFAEDRVISQSYPRI